MAFMRQGRQGGCNAEKSVPLRILFHWIVTALLYDTIFAYVARLLAHELCESEAGSFLCTLVCMPRWP